VKLGENTELIIAIASGILSIFAGIVSTNASRRARRFEYELARQAKFEDEVQQAERILHQYRDPLLDAAQTLQSRVYNIVEQRYFDRYLHCGDAAEERYARDYTTFAVAEYLCWVEIVRRELRFRDLGDVARNRQFLAHLTKIQFTLQNDKDPSGLRVFRGRQRAIAEAMMMPTNAPDGPRYECLGYATFCQRLETDITFSAWFDRLRFADIDAIAGGGATANTRLVQLQRDLIDLINFLDPEKVRIPPEHRNKIGVSGDAAVPAQRT
jgi:hypothetical protein